MSSNSSISLSTNWDALSKMIGADRKKAKLTDTFDANNLHGEHQHIGIEHTKRNQGHVYPPVVAMDCEMVGAGTDGLISILARASVVDEEGSVLLDIYVKPVAEVSDYRYSITGITENHLRRGLKFRVARKKILQMLENRIVVGHGLENDFKVLKYKHPTSLVRDTSRFKLLHPHGARGNYTPSLRTLVQKWFSLSIHSGHHDSVEDARMAMRLYKFRAREWEKRYASVIKPHLKQSNSSTLSAVTNSTVKVLKDSKPNSGYHKSDETADCEGSD